jgi:DNA polymerase-3 subunit delta'
MIIGHENQRKLFENLRRKNVLAGSYLFFGESGIGKFAFARELAGSLENNPGTLIDARFISPRESSIGIEDIREIPNFLWQKPVGSDYRTIIVDQAELLTPQAQNALLKISEEPPEKALIILIVVNPATLLPTLVSRLKRIYFSRVPVEKIVQWLIKEKGVDRIAAEKAGRNCFGRPGLAISALAGKESPAEEDYPGRVREKIVELYRDKIKNVEKLKEFLKRLSLMESLNTNKRIQFQAAEWKR